MAEAMTLPGTGTHARQENTRKMKIKRFWYEQRPYQTQEHCQEQDQAQEHEHEQEQA